MLDLKRYSRMKSLGMVTWLLLVLSAAPGLVWAQSKEISRLRSSLGDTGDGGSHASDTAYIDLLNRLSHAFYGINSDSAFYYGHRAQQAAQLKGYRRGEAESWRILGNTYEMVGDYVSMLSCYHHSHEIAEQIGDSLLIAKVNVNIALFYKQEGDYEQAKQLMEKVNATIRQIGDSTQLAFILSHLSDLAFHSRQYTQALQYARQAYAQARALKDESAAANYCNEIGKVLAALGRYSEALDCHLQSLAYYREANDRLGMTTTTNRLAQVYLLLKDYPRAVAYAQESFSSAAKMRRKPELEGSARVLADIYEAKGDDRNALKYYKVYKAYSDSLDNDISHKQLLALSAGNDYEKQKLSLREEEARKEVLYLRRLRKQSLQISITIFVIVVLSLIAFILLRSRRFIRRTNQLLREKNGKIEQQKEELEHQAVQLLLNNQQKDKLFSIIAHDLRGPLNSLKVMMDFLKEKRLSEEELSGMLKEIRRNVDYSSEMVTNLLYWASSQLHGLVVMPVSLPLKPMAAEIFGLFVQQAQEKGVRLQSLLSDELEGYGDKDMIEIVLRNLISNAIKFCRDGDAVTISAEVCDSEIEVCIADTGIGMKEDMLEKIIRKESFTSYGTAKEKGTGLGLLLCREFTEMNKGRFWVESQWGNGSRSYFTIPLAPNSSSIRL